MRPALRPRHPSRAPVPTSPAAVRAAWREWFAVVRGRCAAAAADRAYDKAEEVRLAQHVLNTARAPFPVADAPARGMAAAFSSLSRTFLETTGMERRRRMAPALERLAEALDALLEEQNLAAAARARAMIGERDE